MTVNKRDGVTKITLNDYRRAKDSLPKLEKAQAVVSIWEKTVKQMGEREGQMVIAVESTPEGMTATYCTVPTDEVAF